MGIDYYCWDGQTIPGYTRRDYCGLTGRHACMADYVAEACSKCNW